MADIVQLLCTECKRKNYQTTKNKRTTTGKLEFKKHCRFCGGHRLHREGKWDRILGSRPRGRDQGDSHVPWGVAQLVEQRTPNPQVAGSKPVSPAIFARPQPTELGPLYSMPTLIGGSL